MRLFKLTISSGSQYGGPSWDDKVEFFISNNEEKVKAFIRGIHSIELDSNGKCFLYFQYDESQTDYSLQEVEFVSLI